MWNIASSIWGYKTFAWDFFCYCCWAVNLRVYSLYIHSLEYLRNAFNVKSHTNIQQDRVEIMSQNMIWEVNLNVTTWLHAFRRSFTIFYIWLKVICRHYYTLAPIFKLHRVFTWWEITECVKLPHFLLVVTYLFKALHFTTSSVVSLKLSPRWLSLHHIAQMSFLLILLVHRGIKPWAGNSVGKQIAFRAWRALVTAGSTCMKIIGFTFL